MVGLNYGSENGLMRNLQELILAEMQGVLDFLSHSNQGCDLDQILGTVLVPATFVQGALVEQCELLVLFNLVLDFTSRGYFADLLRFEGRRVKCL